MADSDSGPADEIEREIALGKLYTQARRALSQGRLQKAIELAGEITLIAPDATSTEELLGDVASAQKRYSEARAHYKRALVIEPANIDAERKYGEVVLELSRGDRVRRRVEEVAEDPAKYRRFRKIPWVAAFYSVIPGLGQIYNRQYEKGMALVAAARTLARPVCFTDDACLTLWSAVLAVSLFATRLLREQWAGKSIRRDWPGFLQGVVADQGAVCLQPYRR